MTRQDNHGFGEHLQTNRADQLLLQALHGALLPCRLQIPQGDTHCTERNHFKKHTVLGAKQDPNHRRTDLTCAAVNWAYFGTMSSHWIFRKHCPPSFLTQGRVAQSLSVMAVFRKTHVKVAMLTCPYMKVSHEKPCPAVVPSYADRSDAYTAR